MTWSWRTPHPIAHDHPPHPAAELARRLDAVLLPLLARLARFARLLFLPLATARLRRAHERLAILLTRLANGTWRAPRRRTAPTTRRQRTPAPYLPRRPGWLGHVTDSEIRTHASQLTALLNDPGTRHILATAPPLARATIARTLRGPARLLGVELPSLLQFAGPPRPPYRRKPKPPAPPVPEPRHGKYTPSQIRRYRPGPIRSPLGATPPARRAPAGRA